MIRHLFVNQLMKKYELKREISKKIGFEYRQRNLQVGCNKYQGTAFRMGANVRTFLEQDSSSRITTGKTDTIIRYGEKHQRRVLLDSLENLHAKYCEENAPMSYSLFCKLRPFHIVHPSVRDRETCLCKIHENMQLMMLNCINFNCCQVPTAQWKSVLMLCVALADKKTAAINVAKSVAIKHC